MRFPFCVMKTKNFISLMSLTIGVFVSVIAITACGSSDDDSIGGNGSDKQSPKHISLIIEEEGNSSMKARSRMIPKDEW